MAARKNPTITTSAKGLPPVMGIEVPNPIGVSQEAQNNDMPVVDMTPNDGDNGPAPQAPFANGKDLRNPDKGGGAPCCPAMPGA